MGKEHRDPLLILLEREEKDLRPQDLKVILQPDGVEIRIKVRTAECISVAEEITAAGDLPQRLRIIADHLERNEK